MLKDLDLDKLDDLFAEEPEGKEEEVIETPEESETTEVTPETPEETPEVVPEKKETPEEVIETPEEEEETSEVTETPEEEEEEENLVDKTLSEIFDDSEELDKDLEKKKEEAKSAWNQELVAELEEVQSLNKVLTQNLSKVVWEKNNTLARNIELEAEKEFQQSDPNASKILTLLYKQHNGEDVSWDMLSTLKTVLKDKYSIDIDSLSKYKKTAEKQALSWGVSDAIPWDPTADTENEEMFELL